MTSDFTTDLLPPPVIRRVAPGPLLESPFHKRTNWGDKREFAKSIAENGILQRIVCRVPIDNPNELEIVFGHRRRLGAVTAGLAFIDVEVREMTDDEVIEAQYRENADRENSHPLDDAHQFWLLTEKFGHDLRTLARRIQKPVGFIRDRLRLHKLSPRCRKAYSDGAVSHEQAQRIAMVPTAQQQNLLWDAIKDNRIVTDSDMVSWIRRHVLAPLDSDTVEWALGDKTTPKSDGKNGSCNDCPHRTGKQPDLFPDIVGAADMCSLPKCWQGKMDHAYQLATVAAEQADYEVVDRSPDLTFLVRHGAKPMVARSSGYVDPTVECPLLPGSTWDAAVATAGFTPERALLRDQDGRPRVLYVEKSVTAPIKAAVRNKPESAAAKAEVAADPARAIQRAAKDARSATEVKLIKRILEHGDDVPASMLLALVASHIVAPAAVRAVAKACGVDPQTIFAGTAEPQSRVILALLISEVGVVVDPSAEVRAIASVMKVALPGVVKAEAPAAPAVVADEAPTIAVVEAVPTPVTDEPSTLGN